MKRSSSEFRVAARKALSGRWSQAAMFTFVYLLMALLIQFVVEGIAIAIGQKQSIGSSIVSTFLVLPLSYAFLISILRVVRGGEFELSKLFTPYGDVRVYSTGILCHLYTFLWSLLLIIPGIIKFYSYAMTFYIISDDPTIEGNAAIEKSMAMMKGHKMELFLLDLTFIGWILVGIITLCIGFLWVGPYIDAAHACFYESIKLDFEDESIAAE